MAKKQNPLPLNTRAIHNERDLANPPAQQRERGLTQDAAAVRTAPVATEATAVDPPAETPSTATPPTATPNKPANSPPKTGEAAPEAPAPEEDKAAPRSLRNWLLIALAVALVLAAALYLLRNVLLGTPTPVYTATQAELVQTVVASGRVISPQRVTVALQGSGRVLRVAVAEGQAVKPGSC